MANFCKDSDENSGTIIGKKKLHTLEKFWPPDYLRWL
jgi:hypothetical protein